MNAIQTALSSQRFNRLLLIVGVVVLVAGAAALVIAHRRRQRQDEPATRRRVSRPQLPTKSTPLKNAGGAEVKTYGQLDSNIRSTVRTFLSTAVAPEAPRPVLARGRALVQAGLHQEASG